MKFRKKPIVIEAIKWNGYLEHIIYPDWFENGFSQNGCMHSQGNEIKIDTLEGIMTVSPGDYIICGIKGEIYPCKPDIFEATYEEVRDESNY